MEFQNLHLDDGRSIRACRNCTCGHTIPSNLHLRTHYESKCSFCYRFKLVNLSLAADTLCLQSRINYGKRNIVSSLTFGVNSNELFTNQATLHRLKELCRVADSTRYKNCAKPLSRPDALESPSSHEDVR